MRFPVDEKAKTWAEEAGSKSFGEGLMEMSPEGWMARRVEVKVLVMGMLALRKASMAALRRDGRGERACSCYVSIEWKVEKEA